MTETSNDKDAKQAQGNTYKQSGPTGIGHLSGGEIKDQAIVAGEYNRIKAETVYFFQQPSHSPKPQLSSEDVTELLSIPVTGDNASEVGIDYNRLLNFLKEKRWEEADQETGRVMCLAAGREKEGFLDRNFVKYFPCKDLRTIDNLWMHYTNNKFGLSIQKQIYEDIGGSKDLDTKIWNEFGYRVGWKTDKGWKKYSNLNFNLNAPKGHLPSIARYPSNIIQDVELRKRNQTLGKVITWFYRDYGGLYYIFSRLNRCNKS